jgi:hypothetical protein
MAMGSGVAVFFIAHAQESPKLMAIFVMMSLTLFSAVPFL